MRYLITGISGFVGGHYLEYLARERPDSHIVGTDTLGLNVEFLKRSFREKIVFCQGSLLDKDWVLGLIEKHKPDYIINLASYSSVAYSWKAPAECFINNTNIFLNIIDAVHKLNINVKVLSVGSSEEYGAVDPRDLPLREEAPLNPVSPYAVARVSQEQLSRVYSKGYGIPIVCTRSFNHIGPRQADIFVVSSFAKQIVEAKKGRRSKIIAGDLEIIRDFIDVRDVVWAYDLLLEKGKKGEIYNVCSEDGHKLSDIIMMLQKEAGMDLPVERDPNLIRPKDNPVIIGSSEKLRKDTGFKREYHLHQSLKDMLRYWQDNI
ncbi:MAG: GDP-mannose 4,6-dehydratase [Candidatus Omnitrophota bacterium]